LKIKVTSADSLYVCMHACKYVCMYVCTYVGCAYAKVFGSM